MKTDIDQKLVDAMVKGLAYGVGASLAASRGDAVSWKRWDDMAEAEAKTLRGEEGGNGKT